MVPLQSFETTVLFVVTGAAFLLFVGAALYVYYWLYRDARTNSPHSAAGWLIVAILFPVVGVLLYFLIGREGHDGTHGPGR